MSLLASRDRVPSDNREKSRSVFRNGCLPGLRVKAEFGSDASRMPGTTSISIHPLPADPILHFTKWSVVACSFKLWNIREVCLVGDSLQIIYTWNFADWGHFQGKMALIHILTYRVNTYIFTHPKGMSHCIKCVLWEVRDMPEKRHDSSKNGAWYMAIQTKKCIKNPLQLQWAL